jgi:PhnB protein
MAFYTNSNYSIMAMINPHINFNGNAEEAFTFYRSVFGGDFVKVMRFKELASADFPVSDAEAEKIMLIALPIGTNVLLGNDVPEVLGRVNEQENRSKISIGAESKAEALHLFNGLSVGATVEMPMDESPWGSYFGMLRDQFGIEWMVDYDPNHNGKI